MPRTNVSDPTKAVLSDSKLYKKSLCDYVINVATGCSHGCKFCYVPRTPAYFMREELLEEELDVTDREEQWGDYSAYRDTLPPRLDLKLERKRTWDSTRRGQGVVGVSYGTDPFMDRRAGAIAAGVIRTLARHGKFVRVQTRNPILAASGHPRDRIPIDGEPVAYPDGIPVDKRYQDHRDAFHPTDQKFLEAFQEAGDRVTVGASINCLDADQVAAIEPNTSPGARLKGLEALADAGVTVFVSMSPTYPTMDRGDIRRLMERLSDLDPDVVFHEPINPRGKGFVMSIEAAREAGETELADALERVREDRDEWVRYSLNHMINVQRIGEDIGIPVHLWPDDRLIKWAPEEYYPWLTAWKERGSPESFGDRPDPGDPPGLPHRGDPDVR